MKRLYLPLRAALPLTALLLAVLAGGALPGGALPFGTAPAAAGLSAEVSADGSATPFGGAAASVVDLLPSDPVAEAGTGGAAPGVSLSPRSRWLWPVAPGPEPLRYFAPPPERWLAGHRGVDLAAVTGVEVRSPAPGRIAFAGWVVDRPVLTIDHGGGVVSSFEPVSTHLKQGETVAAGDVVGVIGTRADGAAPHCAPSCLHWGVRRDGRYVDPLDFLSDRRPSVLLPLVGGRTGERGGT